MPLQEVGKTKQGPTADQRRPWRQEFGRGLLGDTFAQGVGKRPFCHIQGERKHQNGGDPEEESPPSQAREAEHGHKAGTGIAEEKAPDEEYAWYPHYAGRTKAQQHQ